MFNIPPSNLSAWLNRRGISFKKLPRGRPRRASAILFERAFESLNKVEQFTDDTTYQYFVKNKKEFILPINEVPTGRDIIGLLNSAQSL